MMTIRDKVKAGLPVNPIKLGGWIITCIDALPGETWQRRYDEEGKVYAEYTLTFNPDEEE